MRLKYPIGRGLARKVGNFLRRKVFWRPFSFFLLYNLVLVLAGLFVLRHQLAGRLQQKVEDRLDLANVVPNYVNGLIAEPAEFRIDLKHRNFQKLAFIRAISMENGSLVDAEENEVPATIWYQGKAYPVELNLKGRLRDHWEHKDMWSFKVKVKKGQTLLGMSNFAIQRPYTRFYLNEWILHKLYHYAGIMSLRYEFVSVSINGRRNRVYALEEGFEDELVERSDRVLGPLVKFDRDFYWEGGDAGGANRHGLAQDLWGASIVPKSKKQMRTDSTLVPLFQKAKNLLEGFRQNQLSTSEVFAVDQLATFFALIEILGGEHLSTLDNIRFYYNPVTSRLEPIAHDLGAWFRMTDRERYPSKTNNSALLGTERPLGVDIAYRSPDNWKLIPWFDALFKDPEFYRAYMAALERVTQRKFLDDFFEEYGQELEDNRSFLHRDYPLFRFTPEEILYENQEYVRNTLQEERLLFPHYNSHRSTAGQIHLDVVNAQYFPVEILGATLGDTLELPLAEPAEIIQASITFLHKGVQGVKIAVPPGLQWTDDLAAGLQLRCRILGSSRIVTDPVEHQAIVDDELLRKRWPGQTSGLAGFDFLQVDSQARRILIRPGNHHIVCDLVFPEGYRVLAGRGTTIDLTHGAGIFSYSPLEFIGSAQAPILIYSSDGSGQGLTVVAADRMSYLRHVRFDHLPDPSDATWDLPAVVTFDRSPVEFDHCFWGNNGKGSSLLRISRGRFAVRHSVFQNAGATALSGELSIGKLEDCQFLNSGKEALRFDGCRVDLEQIQINGAKQGIVVVDKSSVFGWKFEVRRTDLAVVATDLSKVLLNTVAVSESEVAYVAVQKKGDHGPAIMEIENAAELTGRKVKTPFVVSPGSRLIVNDRFIEIKKNMPEELTHLLQ